MSSPVSVPRYVRMPMVTSLNSDWHRSLADAAVPTAWACRPGFDGLSRLGEILAVLRDGAQAPVRTDEILLVLVTAATGDGPYQGLARRVLLQTMLGKAVVIARSLAEHMPRFTEAVCHVIGCLYEVIATYPVANRPQKIAANLALDTLKLALATSQREQAKPVASFQDRAGNHDDPDLDINVAAVREALELGIIDADDELVAATVLAPTTAAGPRAHLIGLLSAAVAGRHVSLPDARALAAVDDGDGTRTPDRIRQRRCRARSRVRAALPTLQAA